VINMLFQNIVKKIKKIGGRRLGVWEALVWERRP
jgi:hypothetical protein